jgi:hypothetical protein
MPTDPRIIGTSLLGHVGAPYAKLVELFGPPQGPSDDGKIRIQWIIGTPYGFGRLYAAATEDDDDLPTEQLCRWRIGAFNDDTADHICHLIAAVHGPAVHMQATRYEVCALPPNYKAWRHFVIDVEYRGDGKWAVIRNGMALDKDGHREFEPSTSNRDDEFLARYRHTFDEAMRIARTEAPKTSVNRFTVDDALANGPEWW